MAAPCEVANKYIIPAIRSLIARKLIDEYKFTQMSAAKKLGVTQAAISQYLYSKRGFKVADKLLSKPELRDKLERMVKMIVEEDLTIDDLMSGICEVCRAYREKFFK
ncbi:MAG: Fis family transcriptional regulator [Thermoprotei archaeon]|nr:MAG: Fis family transcriptional regulator [Thermoprotei archaeon]